MHTEVCRERQINKRFPRRRVAKIDHSREGKNIPAGKEHVQRS